LSCGQIFAHDLNAKLDILHYIFMCANNLRLDSCVNREWKAHPSGKYRVSWEQIRRTKKTINCKTVKHFPVPARCSTKSLAVDVENSAESETVSVMDVLSIQFATTYSAFKEITIEVHQNFSISLPAYGNPVNNKNLQISCNTPNRPVPVPFPIELSPGIMNPGVIAYFEMSFSHSNAPPMAGHACEITIRFKAEMTLTQGDEISFSLPEFRLDDIKPLSFAANVAAFSPSVSWVPAAQMLRIRVVQTLRGSTPTVMTVSGIRLPVNGIALSQNTITLSVAAASGPVNSQPVTYCPAVYRVGSMETSRLSFDSKVTRCTQKFGGFDYPGFESDRQLELPQVRCDETMQGTGRVGTNTTIRFDFVPRMQLFASDTISLHLTGFTGSKAEVNGTNDTVMNLTVISTPAGLITNATWTRVTHTLTFTIAKFLEASRSASVGVDSMYGIKLPIAGLEMNDASLSISSTAGAGPFTFAQTITCDAVGTFTLVEAEEEAGPDFFARFKEAFRTASTRVDSMQPIISPHLSFPGGIGGEVSAFVFSFTTHYPMGEFEVIELHLPGFTGPVGLDGMPRKFSTSSEPIYCGIDSDVFGCASKYSEASWSEGNILSLTLKSKATMNAGETVTIFVSSKAKIALPREGILQNQLTLSVRNKATRGAFAWTPIQTIDPVTFFGLRLLSLPCDLEAHCPFPTSNMTSELVRPILSFDPPKAGESTTVTVSLVSRYILVPGDIIEVELESFGPSSEIPLVVADTSTMHGNLSGSWKRSRTQNMMLWLEVEGGALPHNITFKIPKSFGIRVSLTGNPMNSLGHILRIIRGDDYSEASCISPAIGVLLFTKLQYDTCANHIDSPRKTECCSPLTALSPAKISFSFRSLMMLNPGDSITLHLPGFSTLDSNDFAGFIITSTPTGSLQGASWIENTTDLTIHVVRAIDKDSNIQFTLPIAAGVRLPSNGTAKDSSLLTFRVIALHGMILPTSIMSSPGVQTIPTDSSINFEPIIPNELMQIHIRFTPIAPRLPEAPLCLADEVVFRPGDRIIVSLPTFRAEPIPRYQGLYSAVANLFDPFEKNSSAVVISTFSSVPSDIIRQIQWFDEIKSLVLVIGNNLVSGIPVLVSIPKEAALMSTKDVAANTLRHTIRALFNNVSVPPTAILQSGLIRAYASVVQSSIRFFPASTLLVPNPPDISVQIEFSVDVDLVNGDFIDFILPAFRVAGEAPGVVWRRIGANEPAKGRLLTNTGLANALKIPKTEFTREEWDAFGIQDLERSDYILAGGIYFEPAMDTFDRQKISVTSEPVECSDNPPRCEGKILEGFWYSSQFRLSLRIQRDMPAFENITVTIPVDEEIQAPEYGVTSFVASMRLRAEVKNGIIPDDSIRYLQPVGYFRESPNLEYEIPPGGEPLSMSVSFTTNLDLFKDDVVSILMSGFDKSEERAAIVPVEPVCALAKASWSERRLNITFGSSMQPGDARTVRIPKALGLTIPIFGIPSSPPELNYPGYRAEVNDSPGLVNVQPAGNIFDTQLCVYSDVVGVPTKIKVLFNTSIPLNVGDVISIHLPEFIATSNPNFIARGSIFTSSRLGCDVPDEQLKLIFPPPETKWNKETSTLKFELANSGAPFMYYHFQLEKFLEIGMLGLRKRNNPDYFISVKSKIPVGLTRIEFSPIAGAFIQSSLGFSPRLSNEDVDILVQFQYSIDFQVGEIVVFELPGYNVRSRAAVLPSANDAAQIVFQSAGASSKMFSRGVWVPSASPPRLELECAELVTRGRLLQVVIPRAAGVWLPWNGVDAAKDISNIKISTKFNAAPVPPTTVLALEPVGSFARSEKIDFSSSVAGAVSAISMSFASELEIETGARLDVVLRDWTRFDNNNTMLYVQGEQEVDYPDQIKVGSKVSVLDRENDPPTWEHAVVVNVNVDGFEIRFNSVDRIGTYLVKDLQDLRLSGMIEFDTLQWHPETHMLQMYFAFPVRPHRNVTLHLPVTHGFRIPFLGVIPTESYEPTCRCGAVWTACDCADVLYRLHSRIGPIDPRPFTVVPGIGIFMMSSLAFFPPAAPYRQGQIYPVGLEVRLKVNGMLLPGDQLQLVLSQLTRLEAEPLKISGQNSSLFLDPYWDPLEETLSIYIDKTVLPKSQMSIMIEKAAGFQLPFTGIKRDEPAMLASIIAVRTPIKPVSIQQTTPAGSFLGSTILGFFPKLAGEKTTISLLFRASMEFCKGDSIELILPGMYAQSSTDISIVASVNGSSEEPVEDFLPGHKVQVNSTGRWEDAEVIARTSETEILVMITRNENLESMHVNDVRHYRLIRTASWSLEAQTLSLTFASVLPGHTLVRIVVGTYGFGGFQVPLNGISGSGTASWDVPKSDFGWITAGTSPFRISTNAMAGPVLEIPVERVESIIAFLDTKLLFLPSTVAGQPFAPIGGKEAGFILFFAVGELLGPGDQIFVNLPSFQRKCRTLNLPFTCQKNDDFNVPTQSHEIISVKLRPMSNFPFIGPKRQIDVFWSDTGQRFRLLIREKINRGEELKLTISSTSGFHFLIPQAGVRCQDIVSNLNAACRYVNSVQRRLRQPHLSLSAIALKGMVDLNHIQVVQPLGSFSPPAAIEFEPAIRGQPTNLKVILAPTMDVQPEESFYLYLPEFLRDENIQRLSKGRVSAKLITIKTEATAEFELSWDESDFLPKLIILVVDGNITAGESTTFTISVAVGILLPKNGIRPTAVLTISSDAYDGAVLHQPVKFTPVGTLGSALKLDCNPAIAGHVTAITFSFQAELGILMGESCLMSLSGFTRRDDSGFDYTANLPRNSTLIPGFSITDGIVPKFDLKWEIFQGEPAIRFTAKQDTQAFHSLSISEKNWIRVPDAGISARSKPITVACNTTMASIPVTAVQPEPYIGTFPPGSSLSFHPASAGQPTQISITIVYSAEYTIGDIFSWYLPGFFKSLPGKHLEPVLSGPDYLKVAASWNADTERLNLLILESMDVAHVLQVTVMAYRGLSLPKVGIRKIGNGIQLTTDAQGGIVLPVDIRPGDVQVVGAFITSRLDFDPPPGTPPNLFPRAGMPAVIGFSFAPRMSIQEGETLHFSLRGFEALDLTFKNVSTGVLASNPAVVRLQREAEQSLTVVKYTVPAPGIMPGELVRITASDIDSLIKLPFDGVLSGHSSLTISCNAKDGPVEAEPFQTWQLVGSFTNSPRLSFPMSTEITSSLVMQIAFVPKMRIERGESLTFHLVGFRGPQQTLGLKAYPPGSFLQARWDPNSGDLQVTANDVIEPNAEVELNLLQSTLELPANGVSKNAAGFTISAFTAAGPVLPTPFVIEFGMGMIYDSYMSFGNPRSGAASSLIIQFRLRIPVVPGDKVQVSLPGMFLPPSHQTRFFTENQNWAQAEWVLLNDMPVLNLLSTLTASGNFFTIVVPSSAGIRLPITGIVVNQNKFSIRFFGQAASIIPTPFISVQGVGSFTDSTKLILQDPSMTYAGKHAYFTISFVPQMIIAEGEYVRIHLPNFQRASSQNLVYSLDSTFDAVDDFEGSTLSLRAVRNLDPRESLVVNVTGLLIPIKGIRLVQDEIRISSNSRLGPVPEIPIIVVPAVGAVMISELRFGTAMASTITSIEFAMTLAMQLGCSQKQLKSGQCVQEMTRIYIHLPSFTRDAKPPTAPFPDCGGLDDCSWNDATLTLTLVYSRYLEPGQKLEFIIPQSGKLKTPSAGVLANDERFKVSVRTEYGNVEPTSIQKTMGIGSFEQTSISFSRGSGILASAGERTLIDVEFVYMYTALLRDDRITLTLPGFTLDDADAKQTGSLKVTWKVLSESMQADASWFKEPLAPLTLELKVPKLMDARETMHVRIDMAVGIRCPETGIPPDDPAITIETNKEIGPVPAIAFHRSMAVGSFSKSVLLLNNGRAGSDTAVTVTLSPTMTIKYKESIIISLPSFLGPRQPWVKTDANFTLTVQDCSTCSLQPTTKIQVQFERPIPEQSPFTFTIPLSVGIRIPATGVSSCLSKKWENDCPIPLNQIGPTVSTSASDGPVSATRFIEVSPVGVFVLSELSFEPLSTFEPIRIHLKLTLSEATTLELGDTLKLLLNASEAFRGASTSGTLESVPSGSASSFSWDSSLLILAVTVARKIRPKETFSLTVSESYGILLPSMGLAADDPRILLSVISVTGSVPPTPLSSVMAVYAIKMLQLSYDTPRPLEQSSIVLVFSLSQDLFADETVTLVLPGFLATPGPVAIDQHAQFASTGVWHQGSEDRLTTQDASAAGHECAECDGGTTCFASRISFRVVAQIPAFTTVTLMIAFGWVRLPSTGLQQNDKTIKFRAANKYGNILVSGAVQQSMKVTSLISNLGLKLPVGFAGRVSPVVAQFDVMTRLPAGTSVLISLPHFQGDEQWQAHCYRRFPSADCVYFQEHAVYDTQYARFVTRVNHAAQPVTSSSTSLTLPKLAPKTNSNFTAIWQPIHKTLRLTALSDIESCRISITVPTTSGIRVPVAGLQAKNARITMVFSLPLMESGAKTIKNVIAKQFSVDNVTRVGALYYDSSIKFLHSAEALRSPIAIEIGLSLTAGLRMLDTISIILPSFGAPTIPTLNISKPAHFTLGSARFAASWSLVQEELVLTVIHGSISQSRITVTVPSEWGFLLPATGVHIESGVMISVKESDGGAAWRSKFESQHLIGTFVRSSLTMSRQLANGLDWRNVGDVKPNEGRPITSGRLANLLKSRTKFTQKEFNDFGISDMLPLRIGDYIKSGSTYFTPIVTGTQGQVGLGEAAAINLTFALSVPLMRGESVAVTLTGLKRTLPFPTNLQPCETASVLPTSDALLPSDWSHCLAKDNTGLLVHEILVDKKLLTSGVFQRTLTCQGQNCACRWYGPACDLYCEDLKTCNGNGFCTGYGNCVCFSPFYGPFCNQTRASVGATTTSCDDENNVQSKVSVAGSASITVAWRESPPSLTFTVVSSQPLAAWTVLSYSIPISYNLTVSNNGIASAEWGARLNTTFNNSKVEIVATKWHRPKCYSKPLIISSDSGSMCAGINPVRVCATSVDAAQVS
jgi:hypothetical protein